MEQGRTMQLHRVVLSYFGGPFSSVVGHAMASFRAVQQAWSDLPQAEGLCPACGSIRENEA
jgi:hypothetical protein